MIATLFIYIIITELHSYEDYINRNERSIEYVDASIYIFFSTIFKRGSKTGRSIVRRGFTVCM